VFLDLGGTGAKSDAFALWHAQWLGREIRVLNYYEAQGQDMEYHLNWMRDNHLGPDECDSVCLPHDGATYDRVHRASFESAFQEAGYDVTVIPNQGKGAAMKRVNEARKLFPLCLFDEEKCAAGLEALAWYHAKIDDKRNIDLGPEHDWASHGADAFGLMAVAYETPRVFTKPNVRRAMAGKDNRHDIIDPLYARQGRPRVNTSRGRR
jgi:phage terminase large subunit